MTSDILYILKITGASLAICILIAFISCRLFRYVEIKVWNNGISMETGEPWELVKEEDGSSVYCSKGVFITLYYYKPEK